MTLDAKIAGATTMPVDVHLEQNLDVNLNEDTVSIKDLLQAAGTETKGNVDIPPSPATCNSVASWPPLRCQQGTGSHRRSPHRNRQPGVEQNCPGRHPGRRACSAAPRPDPGRQHPQRQRRPGQPGKWQDHLYLVLDKITWTATCRLPVAIAKPPQPVAAKPAAPPACPDELIPVETLRPLLVDGKLAIGTVVYASPPAT